MFGVKEIDSKQTQKSVSSLFPRVLNAVWETKA